MFSSELWMWKIVQGTSAIAKYVYDKQAIFIRLLLATVDVAQCCKQSPDDRHLLMTAVAGDVG